MPFDMTSYKDFCDDFDSDHERIPTPRDVWEILATVTAELNECEAVKQGYHDALLKAAAERDELKAELVEAMLKAAEQGE